MLIALEVMFRQSEKNVGLLTSSSSKHYLWTYGPTAGKEASDDRGAYLIK
jgi:hypothetical protein